jgi:predicted phage terminase large subunit-like protein
MNSDEVLRLARLDLACYAIAVWPKFELAMHHLLMADLLEAVERGDLLRLMLFLPPRHGKSLLGTQIFAAWYLGRHPDRSIISASYGQQLADDFGRQVRNLVNSPVHRAIFPECRLAADSNSMHRFGTTAGGSYYAVGCGGPTTGRGADLLLIDDPVKGAEDARSKVSRDSVHEWYSSVARTRLQPDGTIVLISTRWHEDDLPGRLLLADRGKNWHVLSLPAVAETDEGFRRAGEALWPEKFPLAILDQTRKEVGTAVWAALYQQRPSAADGTVFKREWFCCYREQPRLKRIVQSWDTAYKANSENDYSVCTTWGVGENGYYLLHCWRGRVEFPELKKRMRWLASEYKPNQILVEDCASGQSVIQELRCETALPIIAVKVDRDKISRAQAVTPLIEAGKVFLLESAPWLPDFMDEFAAFPTGVHDDIVDSTTQALNYIRHEPVYEVHVYPVRI